MFPFFGDCTFQKSRTACASHTLCASGTSHSISCCANRASHIWCACGTFILIAFLATLTCSLPPHVCHISRPSLLAPIRLFLPFLLVPPLPSLLFVFPDCLLLCTCWNMAFCSHSRSWTMPSHPFLSYVFPFLCHHCSHCLLVFPIPPVDVHFQILRRQSSNCW